MDSDEGKLARARREMVDYQLRSRGICDPAILRAFLEVPRELFVPASSAHEAYADRPVPIGHGQTISQPLVVALMLQELAVEPQHRVLDIGVGSGYQTALLAKLAKKVYGVERIDHLTRSAARALASLHVSNVELRTGDGSLGWLEEAPFDRIVCGAGAPDVPHSWVEQLTEDGRIVLPVGGPDAQVLIVVEKNGPQIHRREICDVRFVKLIGQEAWPT